MTALLTALGSGLSASKILGFLARKSPELAPKIQSALASGLSAEKIVKFFSKDKNFDKFKQTMEQKYPMDMNSNPLVQADTVRSQNQGTDLASGLQRNAPSLLGGAAALGTSYALSHAIPRMLQSGPANPQANSQQAQQQIPTPTSQTPENQVNQPIISQQQTLPQSKLNNIDSSQVLSKSNSLGKIDSLLKSGNDSQAVGGYFRKFNPAIVKEVEKEAGKTFEEVIDEYASQKQTQEPKNIEPVVEELNATKEISQPTTDLLPESKELLKEPVKIEKSSIVATPNGVGEVKEIRNGQALVEVDGKIQKVKESDLEPPLYSEDDIADVYEKLMGIIPEEHRSGFIQWAGYDEDKNELGFIPRGGKYEVITNVTPEEAKAIKEGKGVARTTNKNMEGLWIQGGDTRGGVIYNIIENRLNKKKNSENQQLKFDLELGKPEKEDRGMKPIFDELSYPRNLAHTRERNRKLEERARKKREKDEAKKRKKPS